MNLPDNSMGNGKIIMHNVINVAYIPTERGKDHLLIEETEHMASRLLS